jgi:hypothetical protein
LLISSFLQAAKQELLQSATVSQVPEGIVVFGNFFSVADAVAIAGTVQGDAYVIGTQVAIDGIIHGDLIVLGGSVTLEGRVDGNVKIVGGQVTIRGQIGKKLWYLGVNMQLPSSASVGGNSLLVAGNIDLESTMEGSVTAFVSNCKVGGIIKKNLRAFVGGLSLTSSAKILGHLRYRSSSLAMIDPGAQVAEGITYKPSLFRDLMDRPGLERLALGSKVATFFMNFLYTFIAGLIVMRYFPSKLRRMLRSLQKYPLRSFLWGISLIVLLPLGAIFLLMTVIGAPFALTLMALNVISLYTIKIFPILWAANAFFSYMGWKPNTAKALASGQIVYYLLATIPFVGWGLVFSCTVFGLGAAAISQMRVQKRQNSA